jgi:hypothetical protein
MLAPSGHFEETLPNFKSIIDIELSSGVLTKILLPKLLPNDLLSNVSYFFLFEKIQDVKTL